MEEEEEEGLGFRIIRIQEDPGRLRLSQGASLKPDERVVISGAFIKFLLHNHSINIKK